MILHTRYTNFYKCKEVLMMGKFNSKNVDSSVIKKYGINNVEHADVTDAHPQFKMLLKLIGDSLKNYKGLVSGNILKVMKFRKDGTLYDDGVCSVRVYNAVSYSLGIEFKCLISVVDGVIVHSCIIDKIFQFSLAASLGSTKLDYDSKSIEMSKRGGYIGGMLAQGDIVPLFGSRSFVLLGNDLKGTRMYMLANSFIGVHINGNGWMLVPGGEIYKLKVVRSQNLVTCSIIDTDSYDNLVSEVTRICSCSDNVLLAKIRRLCSLGEYSVQQLEEQGDTVPPCESYAVGNTKLTLNRMENGAQIYSSDEFEAQMELLGHRLDEKWLERAKKKSLNILNHVDLRDGCKLFIYDTNMAIKHSYMDFFEGGKKNFVYEVREANGRLRYIFSSPLEQNKISIYQTKVNQVEKRQFTSLSNFEYWVRDNRYSVLCSIDCFNFRRKFIDMKLYDGFEELSEIAIETMTEEGLPVELARKSVFATSKYAIIGRMSKMKLDDSIIDRIKKAYKGSGENIVQYINIREYIEYISKVCGITFKNDISNSMLAEEYVWSHGSGYVIHSASNALKLDRYTRPVQFSCGNVDVSIVKDIGNCKEDVVDCEIKCGIWLEIGIEKYELSDRCNNIIGQEEYAYIDCLNFLGDNNAPLTLLEKSDDVCSYVRSYMNIDGGLKDKSRVFSSLLPSSAIIDSVLRYGEENGTVSKILGDRKKIENARYGICSFSDLKAVSFNKNGKPSNLKINENGEIEVRICQYMLKAANSNCAKKLSETYGNLEYGSYGINRKIIEIIEKLQSIGEQNKQIYIDYCDSLLACNSDNYKYQDFSHTIAEHVVDLIGIPKIVSDFKDIDKLVITSLDSADGYDEMMSDIEDSEDDLSDIELDIGEDIDYELDNIEYEMDDVGIDNCTEADDSDAYENVDSISEDTGDELDIWDDDFEDNGNDESEESDFAEENVGIDISVWLKDDSLGSFNDNTGRKVTWVEVIRKVMMNSPGGEHIANNYMALKAMWEPTYNEQKSKGNVEESLRILWE